MAAIKNSIENGIPVHRVYYRVSKIRWLQKMSRFFLSIRATLKAIDKATSETHFDLLHINVIIHSGIAALFSRKARLLNWVVTEHYSWYTSPKTGFVRNIYTLLIRRVVRRTKAIIVVSSFLKRAMEENYQLLGRYSIVPNVVSSPFAQERTSTHDLIKILHVSGLTEGKNIPSLLHALSSMAKKDKILSATYVSVQHI